MKVNELEKILNIPRASIRFYEKEGLLDPARNENGYRDYSNDDLQRLKTIIVLRKMGMSIGNIRELLAGNTTLSDAVTDSVSDLKKQLVEINGALELCKELLVADISIDDFDANVYWEKISEAETAGASFASIANDLIDYEIQALGIEDATEKNQSVSRKLLLILSRIGIVTILYALFWGVILGQGWSSIATPLTVYGICIVIFAIIFFVGKKNQRAGNILRQLILLLSVAFLLFVICAVIVLLLNSKMHFLF